MPILENLVNVVCCLFLFPYDEKNKATLFFYITIIIIIILYLLHK